MATKTTNLDLTKPNLDDSIELSVLNENFDIIDAAVAGKVDKVEGKGLSTNDFTNADKTKLDSLENYDDTNVKADVAEVASQAAINESTLGYQRKNLLKSTAKSETINGVTFTVNENGSVTVNGTATDVASLYLTDRIVVPAGEYILSGCPEGGSSDTYRITCYNTAWKNGFHDYGNGVKISLSQDEVRIFTLSIRAGVTLENLTFKPMLRYAEITDDTYEPYKPSIEERLAALEEKFAALEGGVT